MAPTPYFTNIRSIRLKPIISILRWRNPFHIRQCTFYFWWLVRVTLVVDWQFLPQNFGQVVGTYEDLLWLSECTWGNDSTLRWWGHLNITLCNQTFFAPSVQLPSLPFASFTPFALHPSLLPPLCSLHPLCSPSPPFAPFTPPLPHCRWWGHLTTTH